MSAREAADRLVRAVQDSRPALERVERWGEEIAGELLAGQRLLVAGNGGSAAEAQHLTAELVGRFGPERRPLSAICLHGDTSSLTAIANDYGIAEMFARQVRAHGRAGDVLLLLSTSGESPNLVAAARAAGQAGVRTLAITGPGPNALHGLCDDCACVPAPSTATVQEIHLLCVHVVCCAVDRVVVDAEARAGAPARDATGWDGAGRAPDGPAAARTSAGRDGASVIVRGATR